MILAPFDSEDFAGLFAGAYALHILFTRQVERQLRTRRAAVIGVVPRHPARSSMYAIAHDLGLAVGFPHFVRTHTITGRFVL